MKTLPYISTSIVVLLSLAACEMLGLSSSTASSNLELVGPTWQLESFESAGGELSGVGSEPLSVVFSSNGGLKGMGRVNEFYGSYEAASTGALYIDTRGSTYAGIPDGSKYLLLFGALDSATSFEISGNQLRITYGDGEALNFEAKETH